ncbi:MAG: DegQ family serine endoprotease [Burkholderiales bacterium]
MNPKCSAYLLGLFALLLVGATPDRVSGATPVVPNRDGVPSLAPMLEGVTPAVVNISVLSRSPEVENPLLQDPFFRRFFDLPSRPRPQLSAGSGVVVDSDRGFVLTNHHVVQNAQEIAVTLKDRREFKAKLIGSDAGTDIALLKIDAPDLRAAKFGNSDRLAVGDYVVAIGNPFGLGQTVTSGIVSALGRSGLDIEGYEDFIQTDASINPGNSGGALVNLKGELIGINTAIIGPSGANIGIGFAVPSNMVRAVMTQLAKFGEVRRGVFGVTSQDLTPDMARALKVSASQGAAIVDVAAGSAAEKAGLKPADVVVAINGRPVKGSLDLRNQLGLVPVGEKVEITLQREGGERVVRAVIEPVKARSGRGEAVPELAGMSVVDAESELGNSGAGDGAGVTAVERGSTAWNLGLRPGDRIVGVNRRRVGSVQELVAALKAAGRPVTLNVVRGDFLVSLMIKR